MSKSKKKTVYRTAVLLRSKAVAGYQRDFAAVILTKPAYTNDDAIAALDAVLKGE